MTDLIGLTRGQRTKVALLFVCAGLVCGAGVVMAWKGSFTYGVVWIGMSGLWVWAGVKWRSTYLEENISEWVKGLR